MTEEMKLDVLSQPHEWENSEHPFDSFYGLAMHLPHYGEWTCEACDYTFIAQWNDETCEFDYDCYPVGEPEEDWTHINPMAFVDYFGKQPEKNY